MDWLIVPIIALVLILLQKRILPAYIALFSGVLICRLLGFIDSQEVLAGFSQTGLGTVVLLYFVAAGLHYTGSLNWVVPLFLGKGKSSLDSYLRIVLPSGTISGFINNTPLVTILIPLIKDWAKAKNKNPAFYLLPMGFATTLGGTITLMGTSTNMLAADLMEAAGLVRPSLFTQTPLGIILFTLGALYLIFLSSKLLAHKKTKEESLVASYREYVVEMAITNKSPLIGISIENARLRHLKHAFLAEIHRDDQVLSAVSPDEKLMAEDVLLFVGSSEAIFDLQKIPGLIPVAKQSAKMSKRRDQRCFAELVVSDSSRLLGNTAKDFGFRTQFDSVIFAVSRNGQRLKEKIGEIIFQAGDMLLVETTPRTVKELKSCGDFYIASQLTDQVPYNFTKAPYALGIFILVIILSLTGVFDLFTASFVGAALVLILNCCSPSQAIRYVETSIVLSIAASFALGTAVAKTSVPQDVIHWSMSLMQESNPYIGLAMLLFFTCLLTEFVTNNAAAAISMPFAIELSKSLGVSPYPFCMGVMLCASASFVTPLGYQTNLMIFGAGSYRMSDFMKVGLPLSIMMWLVISILSPVIWPF